MNSLTAIYFQWYNYYMNIIYTVFVSIFSSMTFIQKIFKTSVLSAQKTCCLLGILYYPEYVGSTFLQNVSRLVLHYSELRSRKQYFSQSTFVLRITRNSVYEQDEDVFGRLQQVPTATSTILLAQMFNLPLKCPWFTLHYESFPRRQVPALIQNFINKC